ncbi:bifunctional UDP-N-acetylglucosamine diphosphorylase/glucosamine-1-phosphate N-acetyltransferase GlmU [Balneatrix alpica]|uniref:bifunctional UDP-N-acetylglucosamine diphosphorylase/glucosamine-1-phosphate N-acetyltransferase GlmU n=1 Tax=Balneatrix alpica TaxID=75684 RepID=UPI002739414A|nr:bifunctional UDP-N-acetylglucosamine diphosphorylase/glucosamine-1-phosphate N-acetyltransferase GlmU [Balneatrix alpica]
MQLDVVILAAGQGTRMRSSLPKVLHKLAGKPLVQHVIESALSLANAQVHVVVGHGGEQVKAQLQHLPVNWTWQHEQKGTGHAVTQALPGLQTAGVTLVLYGDVPLIQPSTLQALLDLVNAEQMGLLTVTLPDPAGYGRIVRNDQGEAVAIVEHKDASEAERQINEINTGIMALPSDRLQQWLPKLSANNAQGEYYLTDVIAMAVAEGVKVATLQPSAATEVEGVNNRVQLAQLERAYQQAQAQTLLLAGVTLADPARVDVRGQVEVEQDIFIDVNVVLEGQVKIEAGVVIEPNCIIRDATLRAGCHIKANSLVEGAEVGVGAEVGPYARLRSGTQLAANSRIGNFVETKNAQIGQGSKVNHLSYIGDAEIGQDVNVGAGTITCNYDGANKFKTEIADNVFIGSNTALVAPVRVAAGATVGAGSTITKDVPADTLAVARGRQAMVSGWTRPSKQVKE